MIKYGSIYKHKYEMDCYRVWYYSRAVLLCDGI